MKKIWSIVIILSSLSLAEIGVENIIDKVKDINTSKVVKKIEIAFIWQNNLQKAFDKAEKSGKRIMVMVEGENCRWCKKMIHRTIGDEEVQKKLAEKYISVRVHREDLETMKNLPKVKGVPTVFFMDKNKNIVEEVIGYFDVLDFTSYISDVDKKIKQNKK